MDSSDDPKFCDRYNSYNLDGKIIVITDKYNGIPQNLIVNLIITTILFLIYILFHFSYRCCHLVGAFYRKAPTEYEIQIHENDVITTPVSSEIHGYYDCIEKFKRFLPSFLRMSIQDIRREKGEDAAYYITFQRTILVLVFIIMLASICIILPINKDGSFFSNDTTSFITLTIANVDGDSSILWVHFTVSTAILFVAFVIANLYFRKIESDSEEVSDTLMVTNIPLEACEELTIEQFFNEAYPNYKVDNVSIIHRSDEIIAINYEKEAVENSYDYCLKKYTEKGIQIPVVPHYCGRLSSQIFQCYRCCQYCHTINGIDYYKEEIEKYTKQLQEAKLRALLPDYNLNMALVKFSSPEQSHKVRMDFKSRKYCCWLQSSCCLCNKSNDHDIETSLPKQAHTNQWIVRFSRPYSEINWQNLHISGFQWYIRAVVAFIIAFGVSCLFITPSYTLNIWNKFTNVTGTNIIASAYINQVAPSLIIVLMAALLPIIVYYSVKFSYYWFLTTEHLAIMFQIYILLILSLLILPSFGLTGIPQFLKMLDPTGNGTKLRWECIFMPDGGAIFCNYLISAALTGVSLEYLRFGQLFVHIWRIMGARSKAEERFIKMKSRWEFEFGLNYAWTLAMFSIIAAYAVIVPIITPCGFFYMIMKHIVDWHHIVNVNRYTSVHNSIHTQAAFLMQWSLLLIHATVTGYVVLKRGVNNTLSILCILIFVSGLAFVICRWIYRKVMKIIKKTKIKIPMVVTQESKPAVMSREKENTQNFRLIQSRSSTSSMNKMNMMNGDISPSGYVGGIRIGSSSPNNLEPSNNTPSPTVKYGSITPPQE